MGVERVGVHPQTLLHQDLHHYLRIPQNILLQLYLVQCSYTQEHCSVRHSHDLHYLGSYYTHLPQTGGYSAANLDQQLAYLIMDRQT